jgi:cytoskeletal protein CcmA (bactofilin family)
VVRPSLRVQSWSASGAVKVLGNVEVETARLSGDVSIGGTVDAGELRSSGQLDVSGAIRVRGRLELRGETHLRGSADAASVETSGIAILAGPLRARGLVHTTGTLEIGGPLSSAHLVGDGTIRVAGAIEATEVELRIHRVSHAASLRADRVRVTRAGLPMPIAIPGFPRPTLTVGRIDAQEVELQGVVCEYLHADRIHLGADCHVAYLDGVLVSRHPSARVGPESRSPAPYGLSR